MGDTALRLSIATPGGAGKVGTYAAYVTRISADTGRLLSSTRRATSVPVGASADVACDPGRYRVEAHSPSGAVFQQEVVLGDGEQREVVLGEVAPDEDWLDWQAATGSVAPAMRGQNVAFGRRTWRRRIILAALLTIAAAVVAAVLYIVVSRPWSDASWDATDTVVLASEEPVPPPSLDFDLPPPPPQINLPQVQEVPLPGISYSDSIVVTAMRRTSYTATWLALGAVVLTILAGLFLPRRFGETARRRIEAIASQPNLEQAYQELVGGELGADRVLIVTLPAGEGGWLVAADAITRPEALFDRSDNLSVVAAPLRASKKDDMRQIYVATHPQMSGTRPGASREGAADNVSGMDRSDTPTPISCCVARTSGSRAELVVLPLPWLGADGQEVEIEILSAPDEDDERYLAVVVKDPVFASILAYLGTGRALDARALILDAGLLQPGRVTNSHAAAAIGYALMAAAGPRDEITEWRQWIGDMHRRFPASSDLTIIEAWSVLLVGRSKPETARARGLFLAAFAAGVPVFTEGVRRLRNALELFPRAQPNEPGGAEVGSGMHDLVETVARRCQGRRVFTTIQLGK